MFCVTFSRQVPDYYVHIEQPMDFTTMREKIAEQKYRTMDDFEADLDLVVMNCISYNSKDTVFYRAALKLRDQVIWGAEYWSTIKYLYLYYFLLADLSMIIYTVSSECISPYR